MKIWISTLSCLLALSFASSAMAQKSDKGPLEYFVSLKHLETEAAELTVVAYESVKELVISISDCGPSMVQETFPSLEAGQSRSVSWPQFEGKYNCQVSMVATVKDGRTWYVDTKHEIVSLSNLEIDFDLHELRPETSEIKLKANRPLTRITLAVTSSEGEPMAKIDKTLKTPSKDVKLTWKPNEKLPALLEIHAEDRESAWVDYNVFYYQVPHTDIVFETASSMISDDQVKYLKESLDKINEIKKLHGNKVAMDLYITGYTDTVGSHESNDRLSLQRAREIATWFWSNGAGLTTYYRGLGERALFEATPDETPLEANRRATYILTNIPIPEANGIKAVWEKL